MKKNAQLGFGFMRLPMKGGEVDIEQAIQMADHFLANGFDYFDTAYPYIEGKSEKAIKTVLSDRHPRESFRIASKLPVWMITGRDKMEEVFAEQLERTGVGYFDNYMLHGMNAEREKTCSENGCWKFLSELKEKGLARNIGFSFHDKADVLETILARHPETDFVQLQINYVDWEDPVTQSRLCYETARRHGVAIIVMEPVKGGSLVTIKPEIQEHFKKADEKASLASWALRYAGSLEGISTILSGMSNMEQLADNVNTMKDFRPLSEDESQVVEQVTRELKGLPSIACTMCKYCVDGCPNKIPIPFIFMYLNTYKVYDNYAEAKACYNRETMFGGLASTCIECGACEEQCPQRISIIEHLKECAETFE